MTSSQLVDDDMLEPDYSDLAEDEIPTCDSEEPTATYCFWSRDTSRVVVYRICDDADALHGLHAPTWTEAAARCTAAFGPILEANYVHDQAFFRVRRA